MDPAIERLVHIARARETRTERDVRWEDDDPWQGGHVPLEVRALTLARLWAQPEVLVRPRHQARCVSQLYGAATKTCWVLGISFYALVLLMVGTPVGTTYDPTRTLGGVISVVAGWLVLALILGGLARLCWVATRDSFRMPLLAHTAWELSQPLDCEDSPPWEALMVRVREYVELRGPWGGSRSLTHGVLGSAAEYVRLHLRRASLTVRQAHAAQLAAQTALKAGDEVLAALPTLRADLAEHDLAEHLCRADEALAALRPLAVARQVNVQMRPLALPLPAPARVPLRHALRRQ